MILAKLPHRPSVYVAMEQALEVARRIRDNESVEIVGNRPAHGESCSFCNRKPPSNRLFEIRLDPAKDEGVRIGRHVCAGRYLRSAIFKLLGDLLKMESPDADQERRLRAALAKIS